MKAVVTQLTPKKHIRKAASAVSLSLVASTLVVLAINSEGSPISDVDLNDGGVWVTNGDELLMARLNPQIEQLELGLSTNSASTDVFQRATTVFLNNRVGERSLQDVDVANGVAGDPVSLPASVDSAFGGGTIAMIERSTGNVWVRTKDTIAGFTTKETAPDVKVAKDGLVAVGPDGAAYALDRAKGKVIRVAVDSSGVAKVDGDLGLSETLGEEAQLSVVGRTPVAVDLTSGEVLIAGRDAVRIETDEPAELAVQQPSVHRDSVLVAAVNGLWRVPLGGGDAEQVKPGPVNGRPAAPVMLDGCAHAAWSDPDSEAYLRLCDGSDEFEHNIPGLTASARLMFRTNRKVVVLNDIAGGTSWLVQDDELPSVDNWDDVNPEKKQREQDVQIVLKVDRDEQRPPTAVADKFGARAGQATILPVTVNDTDPNGDIVTVTKVAQVGGTAKGEFARVGQDTQIQATFGPGETGSATLRYEISDGRGGKSSTTVDIALSGDSENAAPKLLELANGEPRKTEFTVGRGQRDSVYVLADWFDPDGDDLILTGAAVDGKNVAEFRADGVVTFLDDNSGAGTKEISVTVSDGIDSTEGIVTVHVDGDKVIPPEPIADRAVGVAGSKILVEPLLNDHSPDGTALRLVDVERPQGIEIVEDSDAGTFTAQTAKAGTYYLEYKVAATSTATAKVRLDVLSPVDDNRPPVAVKDSALLRAGGSVLVDVLSNDYDPDDDVIAVQEVILPTSGVLKASLLEHRQLRIESTAELARPATLTYVISDGHDTSRGTVTVSPASSQQANRPPVAVKDRITLRAGAVASIPVLDNDTDPDGDKLTLYQDDLQIPDEIDAMFVSGDRIRLRAPDQADEIHVTYGVRDPAGLGASAEIIIDVLADSPKNNRAPLPDPISGRTVAGKLLRVAVDTSGADPDGDAVGFKGVLVAPQLGRIVRTGVDWIEYQSFPDASGTDTFRIAVEDKYGGRGTADVRIGVIPSAAVNQAPVALNDHLLVRSDRDRTISYFVLTNDVDPDEDPMLVTEDVQSEKSEATVKDGFVTLQVPKSTNQAVSSTVGYTVTDKVGGFDHAILTVDASPDAPLHAPITADDSADLDKIAGKKPGDVVTVNVLKNDGDLDGSKADLRIEAIDDDVSSVIDDKLQVTLAKKDQVIAYGVQDLDKQHSYGFVFVSGTETVPPVVDPKSVPVKVKTGKAIRLPLADYVRVRTGHSPILTTEDSITAFKSDGSKPFVDKKTLKFTSRKGYVGEAAISFEVTDGTSLDDTDGLRSLLTIPINVLPADNVDPTMRSTRIEVAADGGTTELDLSGLADDLNDDKLSFSQSGGSDAVSADISGSTLTVEAKSSAKFGDSATIKIEANDGHGGKAVGDVIVDIVSSTLPRVALSDIKIEGAAGKATTVDIADYATNPYPGKPLKVSGLNLQSGEAGPPKVVGGTKIQVTPTVDTSGLVTVTFTVSDASGDPSRDVSGRLQVAVIAAPEAPSAPTTSSVEARSVVLTWREPNNNGAPITEYRVSGSHGFQQPCKSTTCTLTGLKPGDTYTFVVEARNKEGWGKKSPTSEAVVPDKKPNRMSAPTVTIDPKAMDGQLTIHWVAPDNAGEGSPISRYDIEYNGGTTTASPSERSKTIAGLANGESYSFAIRAVNKVPELQDYSERSQAVKPFGKPLPMAAPRAESLNDGVTGGAVRVTWEAAEDNGDPIKNYRVTMFKGSKVAGKFEFGAGKFSSDFPVENGNDYSFTVAAENRAGYSGSESPRSNSVNPYGKSSAPTITGKGAETDKHAVVKFTTPSDNGGRDVTNYRVFVNGSYRSTMSAPTVAEGASATLNVDFGANQGPYRVKLVPISNGTLEGAESNEVNGFEPYGPPPPPTASASASGAKAVKLDWWPPSGTNGRPITALQIKIDNGSWQNEAVAHGSATVGNSYSQNHQIQVKVRDSEGQWSATVSANANAAPAPQPKVTVWYDGTSPTFGGVTYSGLGISVKAEDFGSGDYEVTLRKGSDNSLISGTAAKSIHIGSSGTWDSGRGWSAVCSDYGTSGTFYAQVGNVKSASIHYKRC